jgi:hypothetical protein
VTAAEKIAAIDEWIRQLLRDGAPEGEIREARWQRRLAVRAWRAERRKQRQLRGGR